MKNICFLTFAAALVLGCTPDQSQELPLKPTQVQPKHVVSPAAPLYDFERVLRTCEGAVCSLNPPEKMQMSQYDANLILTIGLSQKDTLTIARDKINEFYAGMVSSSLGSTTDPKLKVLSAQLSPANKKALDEYDIVIRTKGMSNGAQVHDWGARVRCAPVMANTPWQTTSCP